MVKGVEQSESSVYKPIEDYGVIGDLHTVALVGKDGSIDWCCLPHFSSPSVFASILDARKGGFFKIAPVHRAVQKQMYLAETNVLVTRFLSPLGVGEVIDFMPIEPEASGMVYTHDIVRIVRVVRGSVRFKIECYPAFDYARLPHRLEVQSDGAMFLSDQERLGLTSPVKLRGRDGGAEAEFTMSSGDTVAFMLRETDSESDKPLVDPGFDAERALEQTVEFWRRWLGGVRYRGRWREMVQRSALTLKLLTFAPTGAIVAAPTTSLPEELGGVRNWDYRYTWIRDAAFTVYGFIRLGLTREADHFMDWLEARAHEEAADGSLQVVYGINGEHELPELELSHLEGYRGSSPVRIGNAASKQLQLDIYGEMMDTVYLSNKYGKPISYELWVHLTRHLEYVRNNWRRKDEGRRGDMGGPWG